MPFPIQGYTRTVIPLKSRDDGNADDEGVKMEKCYPETSCMGGPDSVCKQGYDRDYDCAECSEAYYRLGPYCTLCPYKLVTWSMFFLEVGLYGAALICFALFFDSVSKIGSISVLMRFLQTTYILLYFDLNWQGPHEVTYEPDTSGVLYPAGFSATNYGVTYFFWFKSIAIWM